MARYEALKHLMLGDLRPAPGDPIESSPGDGRNWELMERVKEVAPWPDDRAWPKDGDEVEEKLQDAPATNIAEQARVSSDYDIITKPRGWYSISLDGVEVTKSLREDAVEGFAGMSDAEKHAFVLANPPAE